MAPTLSRVTAQIVESYGWRRGSALENIAALDLIRAGWTSDVVVQEHRVGKYRLDFAWPALMTAMEVDGFFHRAGDGAARDAERDADLRHLGWIVFRVDDTNGTEGLRDQVARVSSIMWTLRKAHR